MLKKENRLVPGIRFNNSHSLSVPQFVFKKRENGLSVNRFGIIVSKRIDKRAVVRNRIKRFFRETLNEMNKKMKPGHDIIIIVKKEVLGKTKKENLLTVENTLEKAELI